MNTRKITLSVSENKFDFFIRFLKEFRFVKIIESDKGDSKKEILKNVSRGLKEMNQIKKGMLKARDAKDFLNEL